MVGIGVVVLLAGGAMLLWSQTTVQTKTTCGWVPYPDPHQVCSTNVTAITNHPYASIGGWVAPTGLVAALGGLAYFSLYAWKLRRY